VKEVYLDQNAWIALLREDEGKTHADDVMKALETARKAAAAGRAIFPLSLVHLIETLRRRDKSSRDQLAELMYELSRGTCIIPYSRMITKEIANLACRWAGLPTSELKATVPGISYLFGERAGVSFHPSQELPPDLVRRLPALKRMLEAKVNDPSIVLWALKNEAVISDRIRNRSYDLRYVSLMEKTRQVEFLTKDPILRRQRSAALYFGQAILPKLLRLALDAGLSRRIIEEKLNPYRIEEVLKEIPTAYTTWTLTYRRDIQKNRPIDKNDLADIFALSIAIPYCDVVVTENEWTRIAMMDKLDQLYEVRIIRSVGGLAEHLT